MDRHFRELQLHQTEVALAGWKDASLAKRPLPGWARAIRDALGVCAADEF